MKKELDMHERIIVALDVDTENSARSIINEIGSSVGAFKVGLQLFTAVGPNFVRWAVEYGHRIFLDLKFHDIPNTVAKAGIEAARLGVWMFNVHSLGGREMMERTVHEVDSFCEAQNLARPKIIAVTILTSSDANDLRKIGIEQDVTTSAANLTRLAAESGIDGVVASAHEAGSLKKIAQRDRFFVVTPGIRLSSGTNDDQKRVMSPGEAIVAGSDYLVIGRPITGADDRNKAVESILNEMNAALDRN